MTRHPFRFTRSYRLAGLPFAVTPERAWADVGEDLLRVRFGPWRMHTELTNITGVETSGGYAFLKTAGPAHLSLADRGITFASNGAEGVCLQFGDPVRVDAPIGHLRCPAATLTPADPRAFLTDLRAHGVARG